MSFPRLDLASYSTHNTRRLKYLYKKDQFKVCQFRSGPGYSPPARARNREFPKKCTLLLTEHSKKSPVTGRNAPSIRLRLVRSGGRVPSARVHRAGTASPERHNRAPRDFRGG